MSLIQGFNANDVEPQTGFEPLPEGKYLAAIIETADKPTASGNGAYLELKFQILEGEYKNRTLFSRLNLENKNQVAVKIAKAQLSAICRATGVMNPQQSEELHNKPIVLSVKLTKRSDNGELTNDIKGYEPSGSIDGPENSKPNWMN